MASNCWYCLVVNAVSHYGKSDVVVEDVKGVLYPASSKFIVVRDQANAKADEYFIFVSSSNFNKKKEELVKLSCILRIISQSDGIPYPFTKKEINPFIKSIEKKENCPNLKRGDVVLVKNGYLKNLYGLVIGKSGLNKLRVMFKFHVRSFVTELPSKELKYEKSIYDTMPVNTDKKDWLKKFTE